MVGEDDPLYLKHWVTLIPFEQKRQFQTIFASAVTPIEKSSINTNRKSIRAYALSNDPKMNTVRYL